MRRLLRLATVAAFLAACGGPVVKGPTGTDTAQTPLNPQTAGEMIPVPMAPMELIDMAELEIEVPAVTHDLGQLTAPPREERFFYVVPVTLSELPVLPAPACPACVR